MQNLSTGNSLFSRARRFGTIVGEDRPFMARCIKTQYSSYFQGKNYVLRNNGFFSPISYKRYQ